jgi:hypothetical protein
MSSIDDKQKKMLVDFYEEYVLPLAAHPETASLEPRQRAGAGMAARQEGRNDEESFFVVRTKTRLEKSDFEVRLADEEQVVETMERMWAGTPLATIPRPLMKLCKHFQKVEEKAEVSAFVYEMF